MAFSQLPDLSHLYDGPFITELHQKRMQMRFNTMMVILMFIFIQLTILININKD